MKMARQEQGEIHAEDGVGQRETEVAGTVHPFGAAGQFFSCHSGLPCDSRMVVLIENTVPGKWGRNNADACGLLVKSR